MAITEEKMSEETIVNNEEVTAEAEKETKCKKAEKKEKKQTAKELGVKYSPCLLSLPLYLVVSSHLSLPLSGVLCGS